jgi:hypothetical protein
MPLAPAGVPMIHDPGLTTVSQTAKYRSMGTEHKQRDVGNIAICRFVVKPGKERAFEALLARHYPTLDRLGLVDREPHLTLRGKDQEGRTFYVEILPWKNEEAVRRAHEHPEVGQVWEPMGPLCDHMEFPHGEPIAL